MMEYCILLKVDMDESPDVLDESDLMIVEDFKHIMEFYNQAKTFRVCDDECFMDIFQFSIERDMILKATIIAEKELADANREEEAKNDNAAINERNKHTEAIERVEEAEIDAQTLKRL